MRRILVIKTSSLGDVVHALPAVSDMAHHFPGIAIDWMVEEAFQAIPELHPAVQRVIPVATRRWRKALYTQSTWRELKTLKQQLSMEPYDLAIDFQGLTKSAVLGLLAPTHRVGYTWASAREPLATLAYQEKFAVPWGLHAVERNRRLAAKALGYTPEPTVSYGLEPTAPAPAWVPSEPYAVLLHATSRPHKEWPESHWIQLGIALGERGLRSVIPGGTPLERARSQRLAAGIPGALATPALNLGEIAELLGQARVVVGVDTGLAHLAVALRRPVVAIFTATRPEDTGVYGTPLAVNCGGRKQIPAVESILQVLPCE